MENDGKNQHFDLLAAWKNTPLDLVNRILMSGDFKADVDEAVAEGEEVLGEMSPVEKAIYCAMDQIMKSNNAMVEVAIEKKEKVNIAAVRQSKANIDALTKIMFACIKQRIGSELWNGPGIGVRDGFKVVQLAASGEPDIGIDIIVDPDMGLAAALMGAFAAKRREGPGDDMMSALGAAMSGENCAQCPDYDSCESTIKKPRANKQS